MNEQENRDALAKVVMAARLRKFKTIQAAHVAAGVSRGTWEKIERGDKIKVFSLAAIEEALDWPAGRAQAILDGGAEPHATAGSNPGLRREVEQLRAAVRAAREAGATVDEVRGILDSETG